MYCHQETRLRPVSGCVIHPVISLFIVLRGVNLWLSGFLYIFGGLSYFIFFLPFFLLSFYTFGIHFFEKPLYLPIYSHLTYSQWKVCFVFLLVCFELNSSAAFNSCFWRLFPVVWNKTFVCVMPLLFNVWYHFYSIHSQCSWAVLNCCNLVDFIPPFQFWFHRIDP